MIQLDIQALTDRLFSGIDVEDIQLLVQNQAAEDIDDTQLWSRWMVVPGISTAVTTGHNPIIEQEGTATLQVFLPKGQLTAPAYDVLAQFNALFRQWQTPDKKLRVLALKSTTSNYREGAQEFLLINCMVIWQSRRRAT